MKANPESRGMKLAAEAFTAGSRSHPDMRRWEPFAGSADADLNPELQLMISRSRDLERNHGVANGGVQTVVDNVVGCGLRLKSRPDWKALGWTDEQAETWSNEIESRWQAHANSKFIDAAEQLDFDGLTTLVFRSRFVNGGALALPLWLPRQGANAATAFQLVEIDRLQNPSGQTGDSATLRGGIEINAYGAPRAYHIRKSHPGDRHALGGLSTETERIPAFTPWGRRRVIHLHDKARTGQTRGIPAFASVLRQFKVLGDYTNAELKAAVVNAMVAMVTKSAIGQEGLVQLLDAHPDALKKYVDGLNGRGISSIDFNAGMVLPLALGEEIAGFTPARPTEAFDPFVQTFLRWIAAGLNMPYELLAKDFSKTNYSSARAALLEGWRHFRGRRKWLAREWAQPVFELWLEEEVMEGRIEAPEFYAKRALYCRAKWIGDGRGWIDPLKEAQAAEKRLELGLTTLEEECAEQGGDWEENLEQRAREQRRAKSLDIKLPWMQGRSTQMVAPPAASREPGEEPDGELEEDEEPAANARGGTSAALGAMSRAVATLTRATEAAASAMKANAERPIHVSVSLPETKLEVGPINMPSAGGKVTKVVQAVRGDDGTIRATVVEENAS